MRPVFTLVVDIKTCNGYISYCRFFLGNQLKDAIKIFSVLKGVPPKMAEVPYPMKMELVSEENGKKKLIAARYCTLGDLTHNCQIITKEVFKLIALAGNTTPRSVY